jgi:hypothetical protein
MRNSLESLFDKEGLRELGAKGLKAPLHTLPVGLASLCPPYILATCATVRYDMESRVLAAGG